MAVIDLQKYLSRLPVSIYGDDPTQDIHQIITLRSELLAEIENVSADIGQIRDYLNQTGAGLDITGEIVGEERKSRTDELYKLFIGVAIAKNSASGVIEDINQLTELIPGAEDGRVIETANGALPSFFDGSDVLDGTRYLRGEWYDFAAFEYRITGPLESLYVPVELASAIDEIKSAGVNATIKAILTATFTFGLTLEYLIDGVISLTEPAGSNTLDGSELLDGDWLLDATPEIDENSRIRGTIQITTGTP